MKVTYTEDYIMRLISQAVAVLTHVIGLSKAGQHSEAISAIDEGLEELLGLRVDLLRQLDDREILHMLMVGGNLDYGRAMILAELFTISAESHKAIDLPQQSSSEYQRALALYIEIALNEPGDMNAELVRKIVILHQELRDVELPVETDLGLLDFYERLLTMDENIISVLGFTRRDAQSQVELLMENLHRYLE
jgi:hypothetical protein